MPTVTTRSTGIFALIRSLLSTQKKAKRKSNQAKKSSIRVIKPTAAETDRRGSNRRSYSCWQLLAWYDGQRSPQQADFRLVQCHDLSPRGFSFFADHLPRQKRLIIALGTAPFTFFEAEIVRHESARHERVNGFLLGCRFVRQL